MILGLNGLAIRLTILLFLSFFKYNLFFYPKILFHLARFFSESNLDLHYFEKSETMSGCHLFFPKIFISHHFLNFWFPQYSIFLKNHLFKFYFYFYDSLKFNFKIESVDWEDQALHFYYNPFFKYSYKLNVNIYI